MTNRTGRWLVFNVAIAVLTCFGLATGDESSNGLLDQVSWGDHREQVIEKIFDSHHSVGK